MATEPEEGSEELGTLESVRSDAEGFRIDAHIPSQELTHDSRVKEELSILFQACAEHAESGRGAQTLAEALLSPESNAVELALLTYNAELLLQEEGGRREVLWRELIGKLEGLEPGHILEIHLPHQDPEAKQFWRSYPLKRRSDERVYVAASLRTSDGQIDRARMALGGAYENSGRLYQTEELVIGKHPKNAQRQLLAALKGDIKRISTRSSRSGKKMRIADGLLIDIMDELSEPLKSPRVAQRVLRWVLGILAIGTMVVALMSHWGYFTKHRDFRPESDQILRQLNEGKAAKVYDEAAFPMREGTLLESFEDMVDRLNETLGEYQGITDVGDIEVLDTVGGKATRIEYELLFSTGPTTGKLSYLHTKDNTWKLLGITVNIPLAYARKAEALEAEYGRIKAPDVVLRKVSSIMERLAAGEAEAVYNEAAPPFREAFSLEEWRTKLAGNDAELGKFRRVIFVLSSAQNASKKKAQVHAQLEFEKQRTTGRFKFIKVDGVWQLQYFKVMIPEPLFPE